MTPLNQIGSQTLVVTGVPVALTMPWSKNVYEAGVLKRTTPRHAIIQVSGQPVRWSTDGSAISGMLVLAGGEIDWTDPRRDYWSILSQVEFVTDTTATGNATIEVTYFT